MASPNSPSSQQVIHSVNAKDRLPMLILEAVKYQQDKYNKAVSSQEVVAYIETEASKHSVDCDQDEISLILSSMAGKDGPLAQIEESDNSVKFYLIMDKKQDPDKKSKSPSPIPLENETASSDTDHSELELAEQGDNVLEEDIAGGPPIIATGLADSNDSLEAQKGAESRRQNESKCLNKVLYMQLFSIAYSLSNFLNILLFFFSQ